MKKISQWIMIIAIPFSVSCVEAEGVESSVPPTTCMDCTTGMEGVGTDSLSGSRDRLDSEDSVFGFGSDSTIPSSFSGDTDSNEATDSKGGNAAGDEDLDSDGFTLNDGDCNDADSLINPNALEVREQRWQVDNDCDGSTEVFQVNCDDLVFDNVESSLTAAMNLCDDRFLQKATRSWSAQNGDIAYATINRLGNNDCLLPKEGKWMTLMGTGPADSMKPNENLGLDGQYSTGGWLDEQTLKEMYLLEPQPAFQGDDPAQSDAQKICDLSQLQLELQAPSNAIGFSFDFVFASSEYAKWIDRGYNDTFYAIVQSESINSGATTNISFDDESHPIEVNSNFFENSEHPCDESGSGWDPGPKNEAGTTGWLRTTRMLNAPGESFTLTFSIHDEGDCIYDSAVLLDNFQWIVEEVDQENSTVVIEVE